MILVGQYDSPFVRRVAVTMNFYGFVFERQVLSVFVDFDTMLRINPLGTVPALQLDDGEWLFDSRAILDYLDGSVARADRMVPVDEPHRHRVLRVEAVAVGLTEKVYDRIFEMARRDPAKRDEAIARRLERQIDSSLAWLEALAPAPWFYGDRLSRADLSMAIAYTYMREKLPTIAEMHRGSTLDLHCQRCEGLDAFKKAAYSASEANRSGWRPETRA